MSLLVAIALAVSWGRQWSYLADYGLLAVADNCLYLTFQRPDYSCSYCTPRDLLTLEYFTARLDTTQVWRPSMARRVIVMPLWMCLVLPVVPTAVLFWRDRRRIPPGHCRACGYNLTGDVSGVCPECGGRITDAEVPSDAGQSRSETDGVSTSRTPRRQEEAGITKTRKKENTKAERGGG